MSGPPATYPDNTTTTATFDAENDRLTSTDRAGHTTSYTYDSDKRLSKTTYADQSFTQTNYDNAGRVSSTVDANGGLAQPMYFVQSTTSWMPHPWQFHGWAAMPMGSGDFADVKLRFLGLVD